MLKAVHSLPSLTRAASTLVLAACLGSAGQAHAGKFSDVIDAFEDNGPYVEPFATMFGSISNTGWYQSAGVSRLFGFYIGLPISITQISDDDRTYKATFVDDGCQLYHRDFPGGTACKDEVPYDAPTIFGRKGAKTNKRTVYDPNDKKITGTMDIPVSDGLSDVADLNWLPFAIPQVGANFFNTELKLRYIALPLDEYSFEILGFGLQHDLGSFLPVLPVNLSLAANYTTLTAEITPGEDIQGTLELEGSAYFVGLLVGYNLLGMIEVFAEAGWEGASLSSGGRLVVEDPSGGADEVVNPNLTVDGRNGFRAGLNLSFHFGYQAVVGQNVGANLGNNLSLLGFRLKL